MLQTIFGFILLGAPFLLIREWKDKKIGFVYLFSFSLAFHLSTALLTQSFGVFTYPVVIAVHMVVLIIVAVRINLGKLFSPRKDAALFWRKTRSVDWVLVLVLVIAFVHLYPVHYNYSGKYTVATTDQYQEIEDMRYPYPYFADEWYAIALIKDAISSHSLPFRNPLERGHPPFINLEFAFHSLLAELVLLLNLNPLTDYVNIIIVTGVLICALVYLFLRFDGAGRLPSALAASAVLYITNGANLPGIWDLIPLILGIISMLLSFFFFSSSDTRMIFMSGLLTLLFYPPLAPFYVSAVIFYSGRMKALSGAQKVKVISGILIPVLWAGVILSLSCWLARGAFQNFVHDILLPKIFPRPFPPDATPHFGIWNIVPVPVLALSVLGIFSAARKRSWLVSMAVLGLIYWSVYSRFSFHFFLDYERVVVVASILLTLMAGYGLGYFVKILKGTDIFRRNDSLNYIQAGVLVFLLFFSGAYTRRDNWQKLMLSHWGLNKVFYPAAPANMYLHSDDLRIFKEIKGKRFLSVPWKGTVIGVATDNYPFVMKEGTISREEAWFEKFMYRDCAWKYRKATGEGIQYVYSPPFDCPHFELVDKSAEGFYLYRVVE